MSKKMPQVGARVRLRSGEECVVTKAGTNMLLVRMDEGDTLSPEAPVPIGGGWENCGGEVLPRPLPAIGQPVKNVTTQMTGVVRGVIKDSPSASGDKGGIKVEWDTATKGVTYGWLDRETWDWAYLVECDAPDPKEAVEADPHSDELWHRRDVTEGTRVKYCKEGSRNGWTGTVVRAQERHYSSFDVQWDQAPPLKDTTQYSGSALRTVANPDGYIVPIGEAERGDQRVFLVAGENGGQPSRQTGLENARARARKRAQESKSGQAYVVFKAAETFQREEPPVKHTVLGDDQ